MLNQNLKDWMELMDSKGRVQSIDRAVGILNCFSPKRQELRLTEIADELDLNKSTAHGIITTLKYHGLIDQDEETQKYRLGLRILELASIVKDSLKINEISRPYIDEIRSKLEETVHLGTLDKKEVVYLEKAESHQSMRIVTTIGSRMPAYCTGIGKAMLAYVDEQTVLDLLPDEIERFTPNTITDKNQLIEELKKIRNQGYSLDNQEHDLGLTCVAAPIFDNLGNASYGISVSGPSIRITEDRIKEITTVVKDAADKISRELGY